MAINVSSFREIEKNIIYLHLQANEITLMKNYYLP